MRSDWLMTLALRWMGNLVTDEDRDRAARVWRWAGRVHRARARRRRPPFACRRPGRVDRVPRPREAAGCRRGRLPQLQRVAAYAVILRDDQILLTRLARQIRRGEVARCPAAASTTVRTPATRWSARCARRPGSRREVGETARVYSAHLPSTWREGRRVGRPRPAHRVRRVGAARRARAAGAWRSTAPRPRRPGTPCRSDGRRRARRRTGARGPRRPPALPPAAGRGVRPVRARRRRRRGAARADLRTRRPHRARGPCPAAASSTANRRARPWCARCARRPGWSARSASCSTSTTCTSAASRRPVASRTTTASTSSSPRRCRRRRAAGRRGRRHHRRGRVGAARRGHRRQP